jgi:release factor glutamine methyltransferase
MTYVEALNQATQDLQATASTSPHLDAEVLLCYVLKFSKEDLISNRKGTIKESEWEKYQELVKERKKGMPVAYLTGVKEFYSLKFKVNKHVLIPRPETETLVDKMVFELKGRHNLKILDIGTGSGCIIVSLAKNLSNANQYFGSDESTRALAVAEENAALNHVNIKFLRSDLTRTTGMDYDVIVANLPYLPGIEDDSIKFEPKQALVAKNGGLKLYKKLFEEIGASGHSPAIYLEFGHDQAEQIKKLAEASLTGAKTEIFKDLSGIPRFARIWQKSKYL